MTLLAPYPSTQTRKSLPPSQAASLSQTISRALQLTLGLPPAKLEVATSSTFVASYARDAAQQILDSLIWETEIKSSATERNICKLTLQLAENLASSTSLAAAGHGIRSLRSLRFCRPIHQSPSYGLYAIRKTAHTLLAFVRVSTPEAIRPFAYNKEFMLALATMYDDGLAAIATGYAIVTEEGSTAREPDDWERIWVSTKVAFIDAFHTMLSCIMDDLTSSTGSQLGTTTERAFDVVFPPTCFLNQPLLTDYQRTYSLSNTLAASLRHASEKDARLDLLESTLQALDEPSAPGQRPSRNPGALKILLRSSGLAQNVGHASAGPSIRAAGKAKAVVPENLPDPDLDIKVTQVLDILPSHSPSYVRSAEKVIEALLEGTVPEENELVAASEHEIKVGNRAPPNTSAKDDIVKMVKERRNIFDDEVLDVSRLRIGKKAAYIDRMKADILRRAQEMEIEDAEDEELEAEFTATVIPSSGKGKEKATEVIPGDEVELDDLRGVKIAGDGDEKPPSLQTILELAYMRDPKLFDRDAATRRSKSRAELKAQTGWADEQIEGWRVILERNPKKDKILQKHEFSGNQNRLPSQESGRGRGGGGGRGRGRGGGRGRGDGQEARERAWKDKHKASRANHNRKRGHDKKMARAGAGP
ncbi:hypothetical protein F5887DRAFT_1057692 [Amanita rubescens]|nr:hypothetical protein F5887DRAFT_1057692 [Amanita rubescens]